jgi:hypothetical protein
VSTRIPLPLHRLIHLLGNGLALESVDKSGARRFWKLSQDRSSSRGFQCLFVASFHAFDDKVAAVVFDALALAPTFSSSFEKHEHEGVHCRRRHGGDVYTKESLGSESVYAATRLHARQASVADAIPHSHDINTDHLCDATVFLQLNGICNLVRNSHRVICAVLYKPKLTRHAWYPIDENKGVTFPDSSHALD